MDASSIKLTQIHTDNITQLLSHCCEQPKPHWHLCDSPAQHRCDGEHDASDRPQHSALTKSTTTTHTYTQHKYTVKRMHVLHAIAHLIHSNANNSTEVDRKKTRLNTSQ